MKINQLLKNENILLDLECTNKEEVIKYMAKSLEEAGVISSIEGFISDIHKREEEYSTGIGHGFAIPHAKSKYVKEASIAFAKTEGLIEYNSLDDKPVNVFFMLAVPEDGNQEHLKIISTLARKLMNKEVRNNIKSVISKEELINILGDFN